LRLSSAKLRERLLGMLSKIWGFRLLKAREEPRGLGHEMGWFNAIDISTLKER
jgi:hypothetical protein